MTASEAAPCDCRAAQPRLLLVPGLHDSGPGHWQTWLQRRSRSSRRVVQDDWTQGDLDRWAARIADTLAAEPPGPWIAVAHSFGCLALLEHLAKADRADKADKAAPGTVIAALLVAPADPRRFGAETRLQRRTPLRELAVLASSNDPWLPTHAALPWAQAWGVRLIDLGDAGHVNAESGFGSWPLVHQLAERYRQRWYATRRLRSPGAVDHTALAPALCR